MSDSPAPKSKPKRRWLLILLGVLSLCIIGSAILAPFIDTDPDPAAQPEATAVAQVEDSAGDPTAEPTAPPTTPPDPTATPPPADPEAALRQTIDEALGESNRDLGRKLNLFDVRADEGSISVGWAADDNFSNDLIVGGMQLDTVEVLKAIDASGIPYEWIFIGSTFAMQDQFGNAGENEVLTLSYPKETIDRINWDNFSFSDVFDIANVYVLHPAFETD